jgi:Lrp/AsnC family transcriptional regulator, leucine-responsive regulatory protein
MDHIDKSILRQLQDNARLSIVELAKRVNLSKTPCTERVHKLERAGTIVGYRAELNPLHLNAEHVAFVQVILSTSTAKALEMFNQAALNIPEIQSCHMIAGDYDFLLKIRTRDIHEYRCILGEKINELPHVQQTHTHVVMETVKDFVTIPVKS